MCNNLHIVIGITGGIAAYKSLSLIRLFKKAGAEVKVVATPHALEFVTPLTLQTLSQNTVYSDMFGTAEKVDVEHISLAEWADAVVVAPATANIIGKLANGIADDALSTMLLACTKPLFFAPAMNKNMLAHPAVQENLRTLQQRGITFIGPDAGFLACGTTGEGRMKEPKEIFSTVWDALTTTQVLKGRRALVTAGPTYEPIDPVRFIGNHSSGLMGFALARTLARHGAQVTLVTGPTHLEVQHPMVERVDVTTAAQMLEACEAAAPTSDIIIMSAAVADYTPETVAPEKIKKNDDKLVLPLKKTTDILATLGKQKAENQCIVGFALETEHEEANALTKLKNKNADIIVLNSLRNEGAGFKCPTNIVTIMDRNGNKVQGELKDKAQVAEDIVTYVIDYMNLKNSL
ncbi:MAG: bifunctional phosphopantothenoylcysteine decarboxylase/phosphopantothenate--cysteine ligase CoaBC [Bacteroidales bacterium]|nr:bifunctional phosphopantothenoylcysteine decarboxylase/phosphopantothenate--cysteine ligase CoaBC [Bacteroidales bacterium]